MTSLQINDEIYEGQRFRVLAHLVGLDDTDIVLGDTPANPDAVWLQVFQTNSTTPDTPVANYSQNGTEPSSFNGTSGLTWSTDGNLGKTNAVVSLTTGSGWTKNSTGYTFIHDFDSATVTGLNGGENLRLEYTVNATSGSPPHGQVHIVAQLKILTLYGV